jgi:DNA recombination protein RmuC
MAAGGTDMELFLGGLAAIGITAAIFLIWRLNERSRELATIRNELDLAREEHSQTLTTANQWSNLRQAAETRLESAQQTIDELRDALAQANQARDIARERQFEAERQIAVHVERVREADLKLADWEAAKKQTIDVVKAATLATAQELSNKLLADHKRETAAAKEESEQKVTQSKDEFLQKVTELSNIVAVLNSQVSESRQTMDTVWQALSSPGGAGSFAEVGLENSLKSFGLVKGRDFFIQQQIEGSRLRPDAIVLLPGDTVLVIDSKASKFLLDHAEAESTERADEALRNLVRTMNSHLNGLASKNYKDEIRAGYRQAGRIGEIKRIVSIMCLPTEGALDKIINGDPDFIKKATKVEIAVAGPGALACLIGFARVEIDLGIRTENQEQIIDLTRDLIDRVGTALDKADGIGRSLRTAAKNYVDFASSVNSRLLPSVRSLITKGVNPARNKAMRSALPTYELIELNREGVIDGESEAVSNVEQLPKPEAAE